MPVKTFYATRDLKNPSYGTRMLKAGDPVELDAPKARLYLALGAVSPTKPRVAKAVVPAMTTETAPDLKAPPKPRKRAAKKK